MPTGDPCTTPRPRSSLRLRIDSEIIRFGRAAHQLDDSAVCPYTNICEHCPNFRSDHGFLAVLGAQRADAAALAADAEQHGWSNEATRHRQLVERLDEIMNQASTA